MSTGILITRDVFFASKVTSTAVALGFSVRTVASLDQLATAITPDTGLVILDLECPNIAPPDVIAVLPADHEIATIAFGPHIHEAKLAAAMDAGFEHVMPRSRFSAELVKILQAALQQP